MSLRYYANAPATSLDGSISALATTVTVASITGLPISYPFILIFDRGTASEEVVLVTAGTGTSLTVERGYDSTTAFAHNSGAVVEHGISAIDVREANEHVNATSNVHGVAGNLVGETDAQTLTNKDLSDPTNVFPAFALDADLTTHEADTSAHGATGAVVGTTDTQTLTGKTISADSNTISGLAASSFVRTDASGNLDGAAAAKTVPNGTVVGTTDSQTLTNKTLTSPTITDPTITGVGQRVAAYKSADEDRRADAGMQNDAALFVTLPAGTWVIDMGLFVTSNDDAADLSVNFTFSGSSGDFSAGIIGPDVGSTAVNNTNVRLGCMSSLAGSLVSGVVSSTTNHITIRGTIETTSSGTFRFKFATNGGSVAETVTVKKGSFLRAERII